MMNICQERVPKGEVRKENGNIRLCEGVVCFEEDPEGAREVNASGVFFEVSLALVGVASLA